MGLVGKSVAVILVAVVAYVLLSPKQQLPKDALVGKRVIVTGASSGIGEELAYHYSRLGANVVITARREERLRQVVKKCREISPKGKFDYFVSDLGKAGQAAAFYKKAVKFLGGVDQLVLNHAWLNSASTWSRSEDDLAVARKAMDVNYHSFLELTYLAIPDLETSRGNIAVVSSGAGKLPSPFVLAYSASKHALEGFYAGLRTEFTFTKRNISITVHTLGVIDTEGGLGMRTTMEGEGFRISEFLEWTKMATADDTAAAIIRTTTLRQKQHYYPADQGLYWVNAVNVLCPEMLDALSSVLGLYKEKEA